MAGIAGFEPALLASKARALNAWLYPKIVEIRAGLEPVIATVKGLCPNHLDHISGTNLCFSYVAKPNVDVDLLFLTY